jgi:hypothetical protein
MLTIPNKLQWDGEAGHYEVYYVTLTDPRSGVGVWIRYTMVAPLVQTGDAPTCSLWFLAMDPNQHRVAGGKHTLPVAAMQAESDPFELRIGEATLSDRGMRGGFDDLEWDLRWSPSTKHYEHVHPLLRRLKVAQTVLVLPHADLTIDGTLGFAGRRLELEAVRGGQAHLWGSKHASSWAWVHCNDFASLEGDKMAGTFVDAVSVFVSRLGREAGPNTPVVGCIDGEDFTSTSARRILGNESTFALTGWRFEAIDGARKLVAEVDADRDLLAGVTYHDPDGQLAYCYNGETASMRLHVYERARRVGGWTHRQTLVAPGRAHFEYAQRTAVEGLELVTT